MLWCALAVELAPDYGVAHGVLALGLATGCIYTFRQDQSLRGEAIEHAERALELAANDPNVLWTLSWAFTSAERIADGLACGERAVAANPNNANSRNALAQALIAHNRPKDAISELDEADRIAPRGFNYHISLGNRGCAQRMAGQIDEALETFDRALQLSPNFAGGLAGKLHCLAKLGRWQEARDITARLRALYPFVTLELDISGATHPLLGQLAEENAAIVRRLWEDPPTSGTPHT